MTKTIVKNQVLENLLYLFTNIFDVRKKTAERRVGAAESKRRSMKFGNTLWTNKTKRKGHSQINEKIKRNMYAWITRYIQFFQ